MDHLVWDIDALRRMVSQLWEASGSLHGCHDELRAACAAGDELFRTNGGVSKRLMEQAHSLTARTDAVGDECERLAAALLRILERMNETEQALQRMAEDLAEEPAKEPFLLPRRGYIPVVPPLIPEYILPTNTPNFPFVPSWLQEVVDRRLCM